jgi:hypothetical protein
MVSSLGMFVSFQERRGSALSSVIFVLSNLLAIHYTIVKMDDINQGEISRSKILSTQRTWASLQQSI